jgi:prevent-host-death family protein
VTARIHPISTVKRRAGVSRARCLARILAMTTVPLARARDQLSALVDDVAATHERIVITRNGIPAVVLLAVEDLHALEETLDILSEPGVVAALAAEDATAQEVDPAELRRDVARARGW